jgi:hypothetical protein
MDGLEDKLTSFLSDPSAMDQVLSMARALGLGEPQSEAPKEAPSEEPHSIAPVEDPMLRTLISAVLDAGKDNGKEAALFGALRPYVRAERQEKLDRAAQAAKMAHIAGAAIKSLNGQA